MSLPLTLRAGKLEVILDDVGCGVQIARLSDGDAVIELAAEPLVQLQFIQGQGTILRLDSGEVGATEPEIERTADGARLHWSLWWPTTSPIVNVLSGRSGSVRVTTGFRLDEQGLDLSLRVEGSTPGLALSEIRFPAWRFPTPPEPEGSYFFWPWMGGGIIPDPGRRVRPEEDVFPGIFGGWRYPFSLASLQVFAYYTRARDLLVWYPKDGRGGQKFFEFGGELTSFRFTTAHFVPQDDLPGNPPFADYELPYPYRVEVGRGHWWDAAERYREFALKQPWCARGPLETATGFSPRIRELDIGLLRGSPAVGEGFYDFEAYVDDMRSLGAFLGTKRLQSLWFYWHEHLFDTLWPDWKLKPGVKEAIGAAQAEGFGVALYVLPEFIDIASRTWAREQPWNYQAILRTGQPFISAIPATGAQFIRADPHFPAARATTTDSYVPLLRESGAAGLYFDVWSGNPGAPDYQRTLPLRGSTDLWAQGKRALGHEFREAVARERGSGDLGFYMISEFPDETLLDIPETVTHTIFFPLLDRLPIPYLSFRPVPFFAAVYHEYQASTELFAPSVMTTKPEVELFRRAVAITFHFGKTVVFISLAARQNVVPDDVESSIQRPLWYFLRTLIRSLGVVRKYQIFGRRLRPLQGTPEAAQDQPDQAFDPDLHGSVWQHESRLGVLLTNTSESERSFEVKLAAPDFPLPERYLLIEGAGLARNAELRVSQSVMDTVLVPPLGINLLEVVPVSELEAQAFLDANDLAGAAVVVAPLLVLAIDGSATFPFAVLRALETRGARTVSITVLVFRFERADPPRLAVTLEGSLDREQWTAVASMSIGSLGAHSWSVDISGFPFARLSLESGSSGGPHTTVLRALMRFPALL